jgi:hypothetical protein
MNHKATRRLTLLEDGTTLTLLPYNSGSSLGWKNGWMEKGMEKDMDGKIRRTDGDDWIVDSLATANYSRTFTMNFHFQK